MNANGAKHEAQVAGWAERVRECRSSGMSVKAWCEEQGINTSTYYRWEREILGKADKERERQAEQEEADREPKFQELPGAVTEEVARGTQDRVIAEIVRGGSVIRIYAGADGDVVRALCGAVLC